jgi:hypothetical protein
MNEGRPGGRSACLTAWTHDVNPTWQEVCNKADQN